MDIQAELDKWLAANPEAQKYISKIYFVPSGTNVPADSTHAIQLYSTASPARTITLGLVLTPQAKVFVDMILSMAATQ